MARLTIVIDTVDESFTLLTTPKGFRILNYKGGRCFLREGACSLADGEYKFLKCSGEFFMDKPNIKAGLVIAEGGK